MEVALRGPSPLALTAGILLLSRSRSFGIPMRVAVLGDPAGLTPVAGPAVLHHHVLASCGVGRAAGQGALVVVPGPPDRPVLLCLEDGARGPWFEVDSAGSGLQPPTAALTDLLRRPDPATRVLAGEALAALAALGIPGEPALLDLLFGAPAPPLVRLALARRAGLALVEDLPTAGPDWLLPGRAVYPLPDDLPGREVLAMWEAGSLAPLLDRLVPVVRQRVALWLGEAARLADPRVEALVGGLAPIASHVLLLPYVALPPPPPAADAVAHGLARVLGAPTRDVDATASLARTFRFLGGRFVADARHALELAGADPPEDRAGRWRWLAEGALAAGEQADELWRRVIDRPS